MKTICITGATALDLDIVADILQQAGMKSANPAKREDAVDIAFWHEKVMAQALEESGVAHAVSNLGRVWEQLASEIFVANINTPVWGWADTRSTWALDYWCDFEPRFYAILVCVSPQQMLARAIATQKDAEAVSVDAIMAAWQQHHQELLRFHHRNPQRSLLVDVSECAENPQALIECCIEQWKLPLTAPQNLAPLQTEQGPLALYLAHQLLQDYPQTASLQHELAATLTGLGSTKLVANGNSFAPDSEHFIADYRALCDRSVELQQAKTAQAELDVLKAVYAEAISERAQLQASLEKTIQKNTQESELLEFQFNQARDALTQERKQYAQQATEQQASLSHKIKEATQENELLLLQLHQVQEELESIFLKHEAAQNDKNQISQARDEQARLAGERQASLDALTHERNQYAQQATERQVQLAALTAQRDALTHEHNQHATEQQASLGHKVKEATQENELLLLQLHQVQEELEHYFLQQQNAQKQLTVAEERWQRMLQRSPDYCDYESIEIRLDENGTDPSVSTWRIKNLNAAGRTVPQLDFDTIVEQGMAGFVIRRPAGSAGPLIRWPSHAGKQNDVILSPFGQPDTRVQRAETLLDLATRDWDLLQTLAQLLINTLETPGNLTLPAKLQVKPLRAGLDNLARIIEEFPAGLRYDAVSLKNEQVNRDYEHLWLHFDNLAFNGQRWPKFEFRLSCASVRPNLFGKHPKLEFPEESGQAPFEAWFIEAYDDFGAKLELRFALPDAMDLGVWQQISESDHAFLRALIQRLPAILLTLQSAGTPLKRSWGDWTKMAHDIQRITALHTAPPVKITVAHVPETAASTAREIPLVETVPVNKAETPASKLSASPKAAQPAQAMHTTKIGKI